MCVHRLTRCAEDVCERCDLVRQPASKRFLQLGEGMLINFKFPEKWCECELKLVTVGECRDVNPLVS